jgi:hypothetical protein
MAAMLEMKTFVSVAVIFGVLSGCSPAQTTKEPPADVRVSLSTHGLPKGFFRADAERCAHEIISYRFVVWLNNERIAVGFNTSPNCPPSPDHKVDGSARVLIFDVRGNLKASRDLPYEAGGDMIVVAKGEAAAGPRGTLLFRIQGVRQSKSGISLLDANLKDIAHFDRFLEQTTFVDHALVFQEGLTLGRSRMRAEWRPTK